MKSLLAVVVMLTSLSSFAGASFSCVMESNNWERVTGTFNPNEGFVAGAEKQVTLSGTKEFLLPFGWLNLPEITPDKNLKLGNLKNYDVQYANTESITAKTKYAFVMRRNPFWYLPGHTFRAILKTDKAFDLLCTVTD